MAVNPVSRHFFFSYSFVYLYRSRTVKDICSPMICNITELMGTQQNTELKNPFVLTDHLRMKKKAKRRVGGRVLELGFRI